MLGGIQARIYNRMVATYRAQLARLGPSKQPDHPMQLGVMYALLRNRFQERATFTCKVLALKGTMNSQGKDVWGLYNKADALKRCALKHVRSKTSRGVFGDSMTWLVVFL